MESILYKRVKKREKEGGYFYKMAFVNGMRTNKKEIKRYIEKRDVI